MRRKRHWISKVARNELKKDNWLLLSLGVARELGMSLNRLWNEVTEEELILWSLYFAHINEEQEQAMKKAKGRR